MVSSQGTDLGRAFEGDQIFTVVRVELGNKSSELEHAWEKADPPQYVLRQGSRARAESRAVGLIGLRSSEPWKRSAKG
jgi:hypothetical protein